MFVYCFGSHLCEVGVSETPFRAIWKMQLVSKVFEVP